MGECRIRRREHGGVDLEKLFRGMTVMASAGENFFSSQTVYLNASKVSFSNISTYIFSFCNGYMSITKIRRTNPIAATIIYQSSTTRGNIGIDRYDSDMIYYRHQFAQDTGVGATNVYGATLVGVRFDQPEEKVDAALSALRLVTKAGRNSTGMGTVMLSATDTTLVQNRDIIFAAKKSSFAINLAVDSTSWKNLVSQDNPYNQSLLRISNDSGSSCLQLSSEPDQDTSFYGATIHVVRQG